MNKLITCSIELLNRMYDANTGLFSFSTRLVDGRYLNDFQHPGKYRYTVNVLAALQKLGEGGQTAWNLDDLLRNYLEKHLQHDANPGNRGLLLDVLARADHPQSETLYRWLHAIFSDRIRSLALPIQETAWALMGVCTYARRRNDPQATALAHEMMSYLDQDLMNPATLLARHNNSFRGNFVSFGAIVYFLMALHHYSRLFDDGARLALFRNAVARVMALQGPKGEWPWFMDSTTGGIMDWYQVYSVHQDAMAMLFLLPAVDMGVDGSREAVVKSYRWLFGNNDLSCKMLQREPFFIFRSIRDKDFAEQPRRLLQAIALKSLGRSARLKPASRLFVNPECRSYHIGWIIHAWAGRNDFSEFTDLSVA